MTGSFPVGHCRIIITIVCIDTCSPVVSVNKLTAAASPLAVASTTEFSSIKLVRLTVLLCSVSYHSHCVASCCFLQSPEPTPLSSKVHLLQLLPRCPLSPLFPAVSCFIPILPSPVVVTLLLLDHPALLHHQQCFVYHAFHHQNRSQERLQPCHG